MASQSDPQNPTDARARLREHFTGTPATSHGNRWDDLWKKGDFLPWDRGLANPALEDTLNDKSSILGEPKLEGRRKRALVPGCGKGYDVLLLASYGYDAWGLEISPAAVEACKKYADEAKDRFPAKDQSVGSGSVSFVNGDFYKDGWVKETGGDTFELIYDYTFFCAMPPELRPKWAERMSTLLAPASKGHLICLEFPTYKDPSTGGPPWAVRPETYIQHLSRPGEDVSYDEQGFVKEDASGKPNDKALERVAHWKAERTHEIGKGHDCVSIWQHR